MRLALSGAVSLALVTLVSGAAVAQSLPRSCLAPFTATFDLGASQSISDGFDGRAGETYQITTSGAPVEVQIGLGLPGGVFCPGPCPSTTYVVPNDQTVQFNLRNLSGTDSASVTVSCTPAPTSGGGGGTGGGGGGEGGDTGSDGSGGDGGADGGGEDAERDTAADDGGADEDEGASEDDGEAREGEDRDSGSDPSSDGEAGPADDDGPSLLEETDEARRLREAREREERRARLEEERRDTGEGALGGAMGDTEAAVDGRGGETVERSTVELPPPPPPGEDSTFMSSGVPVRLFDLRSDSEFDAAPSWYRILWNFASSFSTRSIEIGPDGAVELWTDLRLRSTDGRIDSLSYTFTLGADTALNLDTRIGAFLSYGVLDGDDDDAPQTRIETPTIGLYAHTSIDFLALRSHVAYARPRYELGDGRFEAERLYGGASLSGRLLAGKLSLTPYGRLSYGEERLPSAVIDGLWLPAETLRQADASLGARLAVQEIGGSLVSPYVDLSRVWTFTEDATGTDRFATGHVGLGFTASLGPGQTTLGLSFDPLREDIDSVAVSFTYAATW